VGLREREKAVEIVVGASGVAENVADGHEERVKGVGRSRFFLVSGGKIAEKSTAWTLEHVVSNIQDPKANDEDGHGSGTGLFGYIVTGCVSYIRGIANEEHGDGDGQRPTENEWTAATETGSASIAAIPYNGLNKQPREGATEPDEGGPHMRDSQRLNVGRQERELQGPPKLDSCSNGRDSKHFSEGTRFLPFSCFHLKRRGRRSHCERRRNLTNKSFSFESGRIVRKIVRTGELLK